MDDFVTGLQSNTVIMLLGDLGFRLPGGTSLLAELLCTSLHKLPDPEIPYLEDSEEEPMYLRGLFLGLNEFMCYYPFPGGPFSLHESFQSYCLIGSNMVLGLKQLFSWFFVIFLVSKCDYNLILAHGWLHID